jgi:hypothetical protein
MKKMNLIICYIISICEGVKAVILRELSLFIISVANIFLQFSFFDRLLYSLTEQHIKNVMMYTILKG